ncbi:MAG: cadherin domain-containing protein, partial [Pseudomonadota bacterium]
VGIIAQASDADSSDTVTYTLSDDANGRFAIDANTGVVTVADLSQLDHETDTAHTIEVTATSSDGSTSTQTYTINVGDDTSEAAVGAISDSDGGAGGSINESASNGATVGITAQASDADSTDTVTYTLSDDANGRFAIDANTGVVTVADASQLDHETDTAHTIEVTATSSDGSTSTQTYTINVGDDTSEAAVGAISDSDGGAGGSVMESATNGATVGITAQASDADSTDTVTYTLSDDANGRFAIDANTGVVTVADAAQLDHETDTAHTIEVTATSSDGSTSTETYTINVGDDTSEAAVSAISDTDVPASTTIWTEAFESVANGSQSDTGSTAWTTDDSGALATPVHGVDSGVYEFSKSANMDGLGGSIVWQSETIDISNISDLTLSLDIFDAGGLEASGILQDELTIFVVVDGTRTQLHQDAGGIDGGPSFTFNSLPTGDELLIEVESQITHTDEFYRIDNVQLSGTPIDNAVSESALNGASVGITAQASDADSTDTVTYSLSDDANGRFTIDANTGVVTVADASQLDHETNTSHSIEVTVTSSDGSTSTQTYNIAVTDDTAESAVSAISDTDGVSGGNISENASNGESVGITAEASDADASDSVTYSLSNDAGGRFAIDTNTGVVTVADASQLNYEVDTSHTIEVTATSSDGSSSAQTYTIAINDYREVQTTPSTSNTMYAGGGGDGDGDGDGAGDDVMGTANNDLIYGDGASNQLEGTGGDDVIYGGSNADEIYGYKRDLGGGGDGDGDGDGDGGGDADDGGRDFLYGEAGDDDLWGGDGNDYLDGGTGNDDLWGGGGDDFLSAGSGNDSAFGEAGDDTFIFREGDGASNSFDGGAGGGWTDVIQLQNATGGDPTDGWTYQIDSGSITASGDGFVNLSSDASGSITLADGSEVDFLNIERIEW